MPFDPPCFAREFFFDHEVLSIVQGVMDDRVVADQWGCDVPLRGSEYQGIHLDYQRPLFGEAPDLSLPPYMLVVSFGLVRIGLENGAIEIVPGTHRVPRTLALRAVAGAAIGMQPVPLEIGDVLISSSLGTTPWHAKFERYTPCSCQSALCAPMVCGRQPPGRINPTHRVGVSDARATDLAAISTQRIAQPNHPFAPPGKYFLFPSLTLHSCTRPRLAARRRSKPLRLRSCQSAARTDSRSRLFSCPQGQLG